MTGNGLRTLFGRTLRKLAPLAQELWQVVLFASAVAGTFAALIATVILVIWLNATLWPAEEAIVRLPERDAHVRVQMWSGLQTGWFEIVAETPDGRVRQKLWENVGPVWQTNLYLTPEGHIVAMGEFGDHYVVALPADAAPYVLAPRELERHSDEWRYLGTVDGRPLRFYPPSERSECLRAGTSPHRRATKRSAPVVGSKKDRTSPRLRPPGKQTPQAESDHVWRDDPRGLSPSARPGA